MRSRDYLLPSKIGSSKPRGRRRSRVIATLIATCVASIAAVAQAPVAGAATTFTTPTPNVGIIPFSADVYTVDQEGNLIPVTLTTTSPSAHLYNLAGDPLNLTFGQWTSAAAKSYAWTVTYAGATHTDFLIGMSGLVPNGVYSLFYRTFGPDSNNAVCPNVEPTVALTAAFPQIQKPDPDSFIANRSGNALFFASIAQDLLAAQQLQVNLIYHFDGKTYGHVTDFAESQGPVASLGGICRSSYGIDAMRQFVIIQK